MIQLITQGVSKGVGLSALALTLLFFCGILDAHAEPTTIHCTFGKCQVEINPDNTLEVSCENRSVYSGPYVINTEYRTIRIQGVTVNSPRITTQSLPTSEQPNKATLFISRHGIDGTCRAEATTLSDTPAHDS